MSITGVPVCSQRAELRNVVSSEIRRRCSLRRTVATGSRSSFRGRRTRDRVTQLLLERGAATAAELGDALGLSPAAIRKHLDAMLADGDVVGPRAPGARRAGAGAGRPRCSRSPTPRGCAAAGTPTTTWPPPPCAGSPARAARRRSTRSPPSRSPRWRPVAASRHGGRRRRPDRAGGGTRRGADRRGIRCQRVHDRHRWAAVPAPLPGGARGGRVSRSCARPRRRSFPAWSAPTCSDWPPSRTVTGYALRTSRHSKLAFARADTNCEDR